MYSVPYCYSHIYYILFAQMSDQQFTTLFPTVIDAIVSNHEIDRKLEAPNTSKEEDSTITGDSKLDTSYLRVQKHKNYGTNTLLHLLVRALCLRGQLDKAAKTLKCLHSAGLSIMPETGNTRTSFLLCNRLMHAFFKCFSNHEHV